MANKLVQPMKELAGVYGQSSWPGYKFKELLGYTSGRHTGVDYNGKGAGNADLGYGAYAIGTGKVVKVVAQKNAPSGFGNTLIYELTNQDLIKRMGLSGKRVYVRYMHLNRFLVKAGDTVKIGQRIAEVGNTGTVWAHLHADMWHSGNGLGAHMEYHKDSQLASYLDIYKTVEKYKTEPPKPAPKPAPKPPAPSRDDLQDKKDAEQDKTIAEMNTRLGNLTTAVNNIVNFLATFFKNWK